jgi:class 3 adenylate cyclase
MATLPAGTVTFVFSDIEGSTALMKRLGERYTELIAEHRRMVRETFQRHGGVEIDTQGDAFFFAFARARDAVAAAAEAQREHADHEWPDGEDVRVRMGLHTGEPAVGEEGYLGVDVVRAARLSATGTGGQVLLSETTRALLGSSLPEGVSVHAVGERQLKDMDEPERVFELSIDGVEPPVDTVSPPAVSPPVAPAPPEPGVFPDLRTEELSKRLTESINKRVADALERSLRKLGEKD